MDPSTAEQHTISTEEANVAGAAQEQLEENDASRPSSSSILTLDTQGFLDDTYNAVCEYAAEEHDDMERYILENFILNDDQKAQVNQGINVLYEATQQRINSNMASFEEFAKLYAFYIPKGLPQQPATSIPADAADGAAVQAAMAELINTRRQLLAKRKQNARLRQQINLLKQEINVHGALPPAVQNVLDVLAAKENVGEELAHAGALARQLAPRVATAQQLMRHSGGQVELHKHGAADKEVFRRHASRAPLTVQQLDRVAKQLHA